MPVEKVYKFSLKEPENRSKEKRIFGAKEIFFDCYHGDLRKKFLYFMKNSKGWHTCCYNTKVSRESLKFYL